MSCSASVHRALPPFALGLVALSAACADPAKGGGAGVEDSGADAELGPQLEAAPDPSAWTTRGPGGPSTRHAAEALGQPCAYLNGGPESAEHHNLALMHDGYLLFPWAPEDGGGGISFFDVSDPCAPTKVGEVYAEHMRETHTLATGVVDGREYLAVDYHVSGTEGGIGFFDITDPTAPTWVGGLALPGYDYPDAYFRVALSTTWVGDRLYVAAGLLGVFVIDVSDPTAPALLDQVTEPGHIVGTFHVIGDVAIVSSAGLARVLVYDIGDPTAWELRADLQVATPDDPFEAFYFATIGGEYALFARKDNGGGPIVYDLSAPFSPSFAGTFVSEEGDGGYAFRHGDLIFQGESEFGAVYDFAAPGAIAERLRVQLPGDFDTLTPLGNVMVASVDEDGAPGQASAIMPWAEAPDADPPALRLHRPADGATFVKPGTAIGLSFDELLEPRSAHLGSVRVWDGSGAQVPGRLYVLEGVVNFVPDAPLAADQSYFVEVPAGGVADSSGNPVAEARRFSFSTGAEVAPWPRNP
jgi:hypothetical protein